MLIFLFLEMLNFGDGLFICFISWTWQRNKGTQKEKKKKRKKNKTNKDTWWNLYLQHWPNAAKSVVNKIATVLHCGTGTHVIKYRSNFSTDFPNKGYFRSAPLKMLTPLGNKKVIDSIIRIICLSPLIRHTDKVKRLVMILLARNLHSASWAPERFSRERGDSRTDRQTLPSALSPCFAKLRGL